MKSKNNPTKIRCDLAADAILLNRYVALVTWKKYNTKGTWAENQTPIWTKKFLQFQWANVWLDIKDFFRNPLAVSPRIAYSLLAFFFIFQGKHFEAHMTAFFIGAIAHDANGQTSHSGEPATITWSHAVGAGSNRLLTLYVSGLSGLNSPLWDGNATTQVNTVGNLRCNYYVNPANTTANCTATGGNIKTGASVSFSGVDQSTPIGATTTEDGSSSPNGMDLTTTANNSVRIDALGSNRDDSTSPTGSLDSGTLRCNPVTPQNQFRIGVFVYSDAIATAGSTTRTWTTSGFNRWYSAFEIKESGGGGPTEAVQDVLEQDEVVVFPR